MSKIDYDAFNGKSTLARSSAGMGAKIGYGIMGVFLFGGLAYVNWPSGVDNKAGSVPTDGSEFQTRPYQPQEPRSTPEAPANNETIQIKPDEAQASSEAQDIEQTVQQGQDLEAERQRLAELQRQAEAAQRQAEADRLAEQERLRREAEERDRELTAKQRAEAEKKRWEALRSNQLIGGDSIGSQPQDGAQATIAADGQLVPVPGADSDPNKAFLAQAENSRNAGVKAVRNLRTDALIAEGTMIRGFLETAINTDLPGMVRAVVREDVYSLDGRRNLIPKGSRLTGEYKSGLARGQKRVFIVWNRLIRSDGVSVPINSMGADSLGRGGMSGRLDNHWLERFGSAIVLTVIGGAVDFAKDYFDKDDDDNQEETITIINPVTGEVTTRTRNPSNNNGYSGSDAASRAGNTINEIATESFRNSINIPPTIYVDQGSPIIVFVRRDLDFSEYYADPVQEELARLKRGGRPKLPIDPAALYMTPKDNWISSPGHNYFPPAPSKK